MKARFPDKQALRAQIWDATNRNPASTASAKDKKLERRLVSKIKKFRFASKKVPSVTVTYPIEFLPS